MTATLTRQEQAEAYADLYDVPIATIYRRYGAVLLPPRSLQNLVLDAPSTNVPVPGCACGDCVQARSEAGQPAEVLIGQ